MAPPPPPVVSDCALIFQFYVALFYIARETKHVTLLWKDFSLIKLAGLYIKFLQ